MKWTHNAQNFLNRRRELRKNATLQEEKLWFELRHSKLGAKFKRQHSIGGYILDFYCQKFQLIVEIDGEVHTSKEAQEYDRVRDEYFTELGYKVLRIPNREIDFNIEKVFEIIKTRMLG
jgi:very-short-patch-repair endonuclease